MTKINTIKQTKYTYCIYFVCVFSKLVYNDNVAFILLDLISYNYIHCIYYKYISFIHTHTHSTYSLQVHSYI